MLLQQRTRGHDHSSLTISALRDLLRQPRALTRMTHVRRQSFNRDKTAKRCCRRGNLTGTHCFSIFEHGACAANAYSAAKFRAGQPEIVTDEPKQWSIVVSFDNMSGPINREIDLTHDNDDGSDFDSRHERSRACSNFAVNFTDKSVQTEFAESFRLRNRVSARSILLAVRDIYDILAEWRRSQCQSNRPEGSHALATFVRVEGSSYQRLGARMLIWPEGKTIGWLSVGCLEEKVTLRTREGDTAGSFDSAWFCLG